MGVGGEEEEEERPGRRGRRERGGGDRAETGRGRETENMLDRGGGGSCIQTDMERWDCVETSGRFLMGKRCKKNKIGSKSTFRVGWKTHKRTAGVHGQEAETLYRARSAHEKSDHAKRENVTRERSL